METDDIGNIFFFSFSLLEKDIVKNSIAREEIEKRKKFEISWRNMIRLEEESVFEEYTWQRYRRMKTLRVVIKIDLIQNTKPGTICKFDSTRRLHE